MSIEDRQKQTTVNVQEKANDVRHKTIRRHIGTD